MQVFRIYLQSIKKNEIIFQCISQGHSKRINGRGRSRLTACESASHPAAIVVRMSGRKARTLELLAFDEKSTFD